MQDADESAFTEIVTRHQGLVLGVCRRVIGSHPDVDDAFQATFITLARRPRQVKKTDSLSSWLYTVAWRTSWRMVKKRRKHPVEPLSTQPLAEPDDPLQRITSAQDCLVLDEELNQLKAKYREVLVMTYFSSQTSQQIADQLSVSKGTIDGRIREARNQLRVRLARRGVAIGALAVAAGLSTTKSAAASTALLESTIQLGAQSLSSSVPGTTDLSHLEPFIRAETAMITTKTILTSLVCTSLVAGLMGMNSLQQEDATGADVDVGSGEPSVRVESEVQEAEAEPHKDNVVELLVANPQAPEEVRQDERLLKTYFLKNLDVNSVDKALQNLFSDDESSLRIKADRQLNSLVILGTSGQHSQIRKVLGELGEEASETADNNRSSISPLDQPVPLLDYPGRTPVAEILRQIAAHNKLNIALNFRRTATVADINFEGMTVRNALHHILEKSNPPLRYEVTRPDGVIVVRLREPVIKSYPRDARPAEVWLHRMLQVPVPQLDFPGETPLSEILEQITDYYTANHGESDGDSPFRFTVLADIRELDIEGISSLEDILIRDINLQSVTLENALQIIFEQTDLTYEIRNEVMVITTQEKASRSFVTRVYEVGHLADLKFQEHVYPMNSMGGGGFGGGGGQFSVQFGADGLGGGSGSPTMSAGKTKSTRRAKTKEESEESMVYVETETLQSVIMEMTSPTCTWMNIDGEGGAIQAIGNTLVIRQTQQGHREIVRLLNLLTETTKKNPDSE